MDTKVSSCDAENGTKSDLQNSAKELTSPSQSDKEETDKSLSNSSIQSEKTKSNKTVKAGKTNGSSLPPKRDLTAPTKSSAAKVKPVVPPKKPLPKSPGNKNEATKHTVKSKVNNSTNNTASSSGLSEEIKSELNSEVPFDHKSEVGSPLINKSQKEQVSSENNKAGKANRVSSNPPNKSNTDSEPSAQKSDDDLIKLNAKNTAEQTVETSAGIKDKRVNMATSAPQITAYVDQQTTDCMLVDEEKMKYINTAYDKVDAEMNDRNCDVTLVVGKETFKAHRHVLCTASKYFAAMFKHDMKEKAQDMIEIKEISLLGFTVMLDYIYNGHITLDISNIEQVIEAARFFDISWILDVGCDFLVQSLNNKNYQSFLFLADKYSLGDVQLEVLSFLGSNLETLTMEEDFYKTLTYELLLQFLMEDIYIECSEYFLLQVILNWVAADPQERKTQLLSLLLQIRFSMMEAEELESLPEDVTHFCEIKQEVAAAIDYAVDITGQCLKCDRKYLPRGSHSVITILSFTDEGYFVIYRDPCKSGFTIERLRPCGLDTPDYQGMSQAKLGNYLYAAGGYDESLASTGRMFRFDPRFRDWTEVAPMTQPRVSFSLCSSSCKLFAVGGIYRNSDDSSDLETILDSVEMYSPQENQWTRLKPMPVGIFEMAVAYMDGSLYVSGGISSNPADPYPLGSMYCLKLDGDNEWVKKPDMLVHRQGHSLTPHKGKLYAIGGYRMPDGAFNDCLENEMYDTETEQWTLIAPTPSEYGHLFRHNGVHNDAVFCLGGHTHEAFLYMYDIESDTWSEVEKVGPNVQKLAVLDVAYP